MINNPHKLQILKKALNNKVKIVLPEIKDSRIVEASKALTELGFCIVDPSKIYDRKKDLIKNIINKKFLENWNNEMVESYFEDLNNLSLVALNQGEVDCLITGASTSTAEVIRSSIRLVGIEKKTQWITSMFYMISPDYKNTFTYADCAVIPDPNEKQLCTIAYESAKNHKLLSNQEPHVAFLSFSTNSSAEHYTIKKIQKAIKLFKKKHPNIICDGEIQFDAAINESVDLRKNNKSILRGKANVFIFPDLNSGNISYKITQYLAGYSAWGPLLSGFNRPIHDLSRGCTVEDIVCIAMIGALQAQ
tara:strand:+ start:2079 stop:2993 length:915 start_codon:yes stop_codon:yes gene_type:complete